MADEVKASDGGASSEPASETPEKPEPDSAAPASEDKPAGETPAASDSGNTPGASDSANPDASAFAQGLSGNTDQNDPSKTGGVTPLVKDVVLAPFGPPPAAASGTSAPAAPAPAPAAAPPAGLPTHKFLVTPDTSTTPAPPSAPPAAPVTPNAPAAGAPAPAANSAPPAAPAPAPKSVPDAGVMPKVVAPAPGSSPKPPPSDSKTPPSGAGPAATTTPPPVLPPTDPSKIPAPAPPQATADPKAAAKTAAPPPIDPKVKEVLDTVLPGGKTVAETADAATMKDWAEHAANDKGNPPDAITLYYNALVEADKLAHGFSAPDPAALGRPDIHFTPEESAKIYSNAKVAASLAAGAKDPAVQAWLADHAKANLDKVIADNSYKVAPATAAADGSGTTPATETGIKFPPGTSADSLAKAQQDYLHDPAVKTAVNNMSPQDQAKFIKEATGVLSSAGVSEFNVKGARNDLINGAREASGQPTLVIDSTTNDFVTTGDGKGVLVNDPVSKLPVALGADNKPLTDKNGNTLLYNPDGSQMKDVTGTPVVLSKSNVPVGINVNNGQQTVVDPVTHQFVKDAKGNLLVVDPKTLGTAALDGNGKIQADAKGNPYVYNPANGKQVFNPATNNPIVTDVVSKQTVELGPNGEFVGDPAGNAYVANPLDGSRVLDPNKTPAVVDPSGSGLAVTIDPLTKIASVVDARNGKFFEVKSPEGITARMIVDPVSKQPVMAILDKDNHVLKDPAGTIVTADKTSGLASVKDSKSGDTVLVDPTNGKWKVDSKGNTLVVDKSGVAVAKDLATGKFVVAGNGGGKVIYDAKTSTPLGNPTAPGNYIVLDPKSGFASEVNHATGDFVKDSAGSQIVSDMATGKHLLDPAGREVTVSPTTNTAVSTNQYGTQWVVNPLNGNYITDSKGNYAIIDPASQMPVKADGNGKAVPLIVNGKEVGAQVVNPANGETLKDASGKPILIDPATKQPSAYDPVKGFAPAAPANTLVLGPDNKTIPTADGKGVLAKDAASGHYIAVDPNTKQPIPDAKSGLVPLLDANGKQVTNGKDNIQLDKTGIPIAVDADGHPVADANGYRQVYDANGNALTDANKNPVVLTANGAPIFKDKTTGDPLKEAGSGLTLVANPNNGQAVVDPVTKNPVVLDKDSNLPVQVSNGKVLADANGRAYLADAQSGKLLTTPEGLSVVIDKNTSLAVAWDAKTNTTYVVNPFNGKTITDDATGAKMELNKFSGIPELVLTDSAGNKTLIDPETGKQKVDENGNKIYIDQNTGQTVVYKGGVAYDYYLGTPAAAGAPGKPGVKALSTPVAPGMPTNGGAYWDSDRKVFITAKNAINTVYWGSANFNTAFKDSTFHAIRVVGTVMGVATLASTIILWREGTERWDGVLNNNPVAVANFTRDLASVLKYSNNMFTFADWARNKISFLKSPVNYQISADGTAVVMHLPEGRPAIPPTGEIPPFGGKAPVPATPGTPASGTPGAPDYVPEVPATPGVPGTPGYYGGKAGTPGSPALEPGWYRLVPDRPELFGQPEAAAHWEKLPAGFDPVTPPDPLALSPIPSVTVGGQAKPPAFASNAFTGGLPDIPGMPTPTGAPPPPGTIPGGSVRVGPPPPAGVQGPAGLEVYNPATMQWEPFSQAGAATGATAPLTGAGALATTTESKIWSAMKTGAKWANGPLNALMGAIQIYTGSMEVNSGIATGNGFKVASGVLNIAGGAAWLTAGTAMAFTSLGTELGWGGMAMAGAAWFGPLGLLAGFGLGFVAGIVQMATPGFWDAPGKKFTGSVTGNSQNLAPGAEDFVNGKYGKANPPQTVGDRTGGRFG